MTDTTGNVNPAMLRLAGLAKETNRKQDIEIILTNENEVSAGKYIKLVGVPHTESLRLNIRNKYMDSSGISWDKWNYMVDL